MSNENENVELPLGQWFMLESIDDDYYGLWEIPSELSQWISGSENPPEETIIEDRPKLISWLVEIFESLLAKNLIAVFSGESFQGEEKRLDLNEAQKALTNRLNYDYQNIPNFHVRVTSTAAGKLFLREHRYPKKQTFKTGIVDEFGKLSI